MDASRTDVESRAPPKRARSCRVTLLVALQNVLNVLLTGCLLTALYVYWTHSEPEFPEDVHIQFSPIADIFGNTTLKFEHVLHKNLMNLTDGSRISSQCRGPYILYIDVCYISLQDQASGTLELQVSGSKEPRSTIQLQTHSYTEVCRGLQSVTYLRVKEEAVLRLYSTDKFKIKTVTVSFNYLLGSRCDY